MVLVYKCPNCGSNMVFDSESQQLVCPHCQTIKSVDEMETREQEDQMEVKSYHCPSCGAELVTDMTTTATFCNYCGNSTLMEDRIIQARPSMVIPFSVSKEEAKAAYLKWCRKGLLTPKSFVSRNTIEKISGIYVPFWLYDYDTEVSLRADCTRVRVERRGDTEYTHTDHYDVYREVATTYNRVPADASEKMEDGIMDKLEPFNYESLKPFEMPYLSGFLSEKYSYTDKDLGERVEKRISGYASAAARGTISGYATTSILYENISMNRRSAKYVLLPVWILNYRYAGKNFIFAMNGQTGKVVGDLPVSVAKTIGWFTGIAAVTFALVHALSIFL
ncbi:zinc ribbon domain-containing protein [Konateibacter massiliensis]|uniref:zinc ribbon domain-containing protein n=1 Tax=Konateibacter massiliensis TaxID=2002841 RepID=UPI000C15A040|nr:zinc ribbon domain-containing protein [Konateibacter massiliensis]